MKTLSNQIKHALPIAGGSADNLLTVSSPSGSTESSSAVSNKFKVFKNPKAHISQSTGDLNKRFNLASLNEVQTNDSQFFEVMYIGKIKVSHKKVPITFIDDAIPKFKAHDAEKMIKNLGVVIKEEEQQQNISNSFIVQNDLKTILLEPKTIVDSVERIEKIEEIHSEDELKENDELPKRNRSASIGAVPKNRLLTQLNQSRPENRTMVFLLSRQDLRLISLNRKQILLHKYFIDVLNCVQGVKNGDHFGIICKESAYKDEFIGYVFKCQSESIATDIVASVSKSFATALAKLNMDQSENNIENEEGYHASELLTCEHCPLVWYNRLCAAIDGLSDKKTFNTIVRHTETLSDDDQDNIMEKFYGAETVHEYSQKEKNEFLLALLEAHCQLKQIRHIHDSAENRSEFLNQHLGGSTIFTKARRSLTNSFENLLKRRSSKDITDGSNNNNQTQTNEPEDQKYKPIRSVSLNDAEPKSKRLNSSANMDIFFKVGNSSKEHKSDLSWRQSMLNKVRDPSKEECMDLTMKLLPAINKNNQKKTKQDYRELWNIIINQVVLLIRMEKENAQLQKRHNLNEIKRIKLEYDEIMPIDRKLSDVWDNFIMQHSTNLHSTDPKIFLQAIKSGVPRAKRGDVWMLLAEQKKTPPIDPLIFPNINMNYIELLKNLTEHQHAIFMDISRTFPNHEYFKVPFGLGQLSLFNLLKAYSILDPELGYCQGLAFICGVLLLHLREKDAFYLLKHLMFKRKMRLRYLPDMKDFQLQLYQVCRLIKDYLPDLYQHFDTNEVTPTLYAAPWILTIFSSSFPLGFVARVFDLLFFASDEVIFRVVLSLLDVHKDELLRLNCFEDIMEYLKNIVPQMEESIMNKVFMKVYSLNMLTRQLADYNIEYSVLKEEIAMQVQNETNLNIAKETNLCLEKQLQVTQSNIDRLENLRHDQQHENQLLKMQVRTLQVTIQTLGNYLTNLAIQRNDIDLPSDIRRVLQQLEFQQRQQKKRPVFGKSVSDLGAGLKVLLEQNENELAVGTGHTINISTNQKKYFQNTYNQIKQKSVAQNEKDNRLNQFKETIAIPSCEEKDLEHVDMIVENAYSVVPTAKLKDPVAILDNNHPLSSQDINITLNSLELNNTKP